MRLVICEKPDASDELARNGAPVAAPAVDRSEVLGPMFEGSKEGAAGGCESDSMCDTLRSPQVRTINKFDQRSLYLTYPESQAATWVVGRTIG